MAETARSAAQATGMSNSSRLVPASNDVCVYVRLTTRHKARHLNNTNIADFVTRAIKRIFPMMGIQVLTYCILPDKLHLILDCKDQNKLHTAVYRFIKTTGLISLRRYKLHLWQWKYGKDFLVSLEEQKKASARVMSLPEVTGLMEEREHYPFRGYFS